MEPDVRSDATLPYDAGRVNAFETT
jgi:hypothetical protein